jgi:uncharacterized protein (TIGR00251 family)
MTAPPDPPWDRISGGLRLRVRLTPKGGSDRIDGIGHDADARAHLNVRVSAPPVDGAANAAVLKLVAKALGVAPRDVALARGATARIKALDIAGDPAALEAATKTAAGPQARAPFSRALDRGGATPQARRISANGSIA